MNVWDIIPLAQVFEQWVMTGNNPTGKKAEPKKPENLFKAEKGGIENNFLNDAVNQMSDDLSF